MKVSDLFTIDYGQSLSLNKLRRSEDGSGIPFVSRTAKNNGVSAWVRPIANLNPSPAGSLSVCLRSRNQSLSTFLQPLPFYTGFHVFVLTPIAPMTVNEKLWWATCIEQNRFRYNFGRQANRTLPSLELPESVPEWVTARELPEAATHGVSVDLSSPFDPARWRSFRIGDLFEIRRGRNILKRDAHQGQTPYVGASSVNNGVTAWLHGEPDFRGGSITVSSNGSVGEAFYQPRPFIASADVTVLEPTQPLDESAGLFICTVLYAEKYRWNYGRKWTSGKVRESHIQLPSTDQGRPDWKLMRDYVRAFPLYSVMADKTKIESAP